MHMSYRVTVVSAQKHNAFIGLLDHDDTCHACSCKNPLCFSDCQRYTLTQKVRCASPPDSNTVSDLQVSNASPLTSTTDHHRGFRSSSVAALGSSRKIVKTPAISQVENNLKGACRASCNLPPISLGKRLLPSRTLQNSALSSRIISPCADWTGQFSARSCKLGIPGSSAVLRVLLDACTSPLPATALLLLWPVTTSSPGATFTSTLRDGRLQLRRRALHFFTRFLPSLL